MLWIPLLGFFFFEFRMIQSIKQTQKRGDIFSFFFVVVNVLFDQNNFLNDIDDVFQKLEVTSLT